MRKLNDHVEPNRCWRCGWPEDQVRILSLTPGEFKAAQHIGQQWIEEGFTVPPYKPSIATLLDKLGLLNPSGDE
jgi:hypothetical protein